MSPIRGLNTFYYLHVIKYFCLHLFHVISTSKQSPGENNHFKEETLTIYQWKRNREKESSD